MTADDPLVSVVIACPDGAEWDGRALASVLRNTGARFDVWIPFASGDHAKAFSPEVPGDPRVHVLAVPAGGSAALHNRAIDRAGGEILAVTDVDCEVAEDWITQTVRAFERDRRIGMVFGNVHPARAPGDRFVPSYVRRAEFLARHPKEKAEVEGVWACMAVRRDTWAHLGGFDERFGRGARFPGCADSDLALRALAAGWYVLETPTVSVTLHRSLAPEQSRSSVAAYTYASGALIGKHVHARTPGIRNLTWTLARRWAGGGKHSAVGVGTSPQRSRRIAAFLSGFGRGFLLKPQRSGRGMTRLRGQPPSP